MSKKNIERIEAAVTLRRSGMKPAQIKRILGVNDWKTIWRIFNVYAKDCTVDKSACAN